MRILALILAALLAGCGGGSTTDTPVRTSQVGLPKSYRFDPAVIEIDAGTEVTWTNRDDFPHNVHLLDGSDHTVDLPIGQSASIRFEEPGAVDYECSLHPQQMRGTVIVR